MPGQTVEWSGSCPDGIAAGQGTLTWSSDNGPIEVKGTLSDGKQQGHTVVRLPNGTVEEGPYVDGKEHGHWVVRYADGSIVGRAVWEGPYVDGKKHGRWVERWVGGAVLARTYVNGELQLD